MKTNNKLDKNAVNRLLTLVETGLENFPVLHYLILHWNEDGSFIRQIKNFRRDKYLNTIERILFWSAVVSILSIAIGFVCTSLQLYLNLTASGMTALYNLWSISVLAFPSTRYTLTKPRLVYFLELLKKFEELNGPIVNSKSDQGSFANWSRPINEIQEVKSLADMILVAICVKCVLAQDIIEKPNVQACIELRDHLKSFVNLQKRMMTELHFTLKGLGITDNNHTRYYKSAEIILGLDQKNT